MPTVNECKYRVVTEGSKAGETLNEWEYYWLGLRGRDAQGLNERWIQEFIAGGAGRFGTDVIVNGDFDTDTDWTKGVGWSIGGNTANCDGTQVAVSILGAAVAPLAPATKYIVTYSIKEITAGAITTNLGGQLGTPQTTLGTHVEVIDSIGSGFGFDASADFVGKITGVSVRTIDLLGGTTFNGMAYRWLELQGATANSLTERWHQYWCGIAATMKVLTIGAEGLGQTENGMLDGGGWTFPGYFDDPNVDGVAITGFVADNDVDVYLQFAGNASPYGTGSIGVQAPDISGLTYTFTWSVDAYYADSDAGIDFQEYFEANVGETTLILFNV